MCLLVFFFFFFPKPSPGCEPQLQTITHTTHTHEKKGSQGRMPPVPSGVGNLPARERKRGGRTGGNADPRPYSGRAERGLDTHVGAGTAQQ